MEKQIEIAEMTTTEPLALATGFEIDRVQGPPLAPSAHETGRNFGFETLAGEIVVDASACSLDYVLRCDAGHNGE